MPGFSSRRTRRNLLIKSATAGAGGNVLLATSATAGSLPSVGDASIRPFAVHVPEAKLQDLRRRIAAAQWPEKETVVDDSQGDPLALMQDVSRYWATEYDWRKVEARLNALPQFITRIDGLDIHFIHVRSKHANALPTTSRCTG